MALTKWNQVKKSTKSNFITFSIVIGFYIVVQLLAAAGVLTNSFSGQLVPICAYVVSWPSNNLMGCRLTTDLKFLGLEVHSSWATCCSR